MIRLQQVFTFFRTAVNSFNTVLFVSRMSTLWAAVLRGLLVFYNFFQTVLVASLLALVLTVNLLNYFSTNFLRALAGWFVVGFIFFWLMSGFNFFVKRYRFGKFTSAIQRFWKRTNAYFWLIEGFLFLLFFYYYLNSSQEVNYMFDEASLNQDKLIPLVPFYLNTVLLIALIFHAVFILFNINSFSFKQLLVHLTVISLGIIFIFLIECYQFYYVISGFFELLWGFRGEDGVWVAVADAPRIRVKQQYFILALIAKYWHFLFIFFTWLFAVFKAYESRRVRYSLFSVNLQNLMLLFLLNFLFVLQWFKFVFRRFYDTMYFWFFGDLSNWALYNGSDELSLLFSSMNIFIDARFTNLLNWSVCHYETAGKEILVYY